MNGHFSICTIHAKKKRKKQLNRTPGEWTVRSKYKTHSHHVRSILHLFFHLFIELFLSRPVSSCVYLKCGLKFCAFSWHAKPKKNSFVENAENAIALWFAIKYHQEPCTVWCIQYHSFTIKKIGWPICGLDISVCMSKWTYHCPEQSQTQFHSFLFQLCVQMKNATNSIFVWRRATRVE